MISTKVSCNLYNGREEAFQSPRHSCVQLPTELRSHTLGAGHNLKDSCDNKLLVQC